MGGTIARSIFWGEVIEENHKVWFFHKVCPKGMSRKLWSYWSGPWEVVRVVSELLYEIIPRFIWCNKHTIKYQSNPPDWELSCASCSLKQDNKLRLTTISKLYPYKCYDHLGPNGLKYSLLPPEADGPDEWVEQLPGLSFGEK